MLWVDKYRPIKLDDLSYHNDISNRLRSLANSPQNIPHLFFYGPSGSGKKTRINTLLRQLYGNGATKLKLDKRIFTTPTNRTIEINMITSSYHIELSPGDAGLNDRFIIQDIIKEMASNKNIVNTTNMTSSSDNTNNKVYHKTVILYDVDQLSKQAQAALRRTMEKYTTTCRLILCCNNSSKVMDAVKSRCLGIRIGAPTINDVRLCIYLIFVLSLDYFDLIFICFVYSFEEVENTHVFYLIFDIVLILSLFFFLL